MKPRHLIAILLVAGFTSAGLAQMNNACADPTGCGTDDTNNVFFPTNALNYPMPSDQYAVQYKLGNGDWTNASVYISYYGETLASPFNISSGYISNKTSMSFVSIPAGTNTQVYLRVTNLNSSFTVSDNVSVRPSVKHVAVNVANDGTVNLSTKTGPDFEGDQFLLWWSDGTNGGSVQSLAFFLDPIYTPPTGSNVMIITTNTDLKKLTNFDTLIFQGAFQLVDGGYQDYNVPTNINNIFLAPGAWVQGKLHFRYSNGVRKRVYGPGVLDGSRFCYALRSCGGDPGDESLSFEKTQGNGIPDTYSLDGIVITDHNHATADLLVNGTVNNVKSLGWNGLNGGFRLGDNTTVSNVFLRCCDDSLMIWGTNVFVTNATVWQNYNGGVVNLGWNATSAGDGCVIDGLYVVKTDWLNPAHISFNDAKLDGQNDAVIVSLMAPGTVFGNYRTPLFRNILIEDPPRVLLSLKIVFPECDDPDGPRDGTCVPVDLTLPSILKLNIENLCTPASIESNSIGFLNVASGFLYEFPGGVTNMFTNGILSGTMNIGLTNVILQTANGIVTPLTSANAAQVGLVATNGANVQINYGFSPNLCACLPQLNLVPAGTNVVVSWPTNFPSFGLEMSTNFAPPIVWKTNAAVPSVIGGLNVVTNPVSGIQRYYRLKQ